MKKIFLACVATFGFNSLIFSQELEVENALTESEAVVLTDSVNSASEQVVNAVISDEQYDACVLEGPNLLLPDSVKIEREMQAMRELNPKDSILSEKRLPEKRFMTIGATAGLTLSTYTVVGIEESSAGLGPGAQIGLNCDIPLGQKPILEYLSIMPELLFSFYTVPLDLAKVDEDLAGREVGYIKYEGTDKLFYMSIPVTLKGSFRLGKGRPFLATGPMLSIGMFGRRSTSDVNARPSTLLFQADPDLEQEEPMYNNVDFSLYSKAGYDFDNGWSVSLAFRLGFVNLIKSADRGVMHSRCISVSVGYNL